VASRGRAAGLESRPDPQAPRLPPRNHAGTKGRGTRGTGTKAPTRKRTTLPQLAPGALEARELDAVVGGKKAQSEIKQTQAAIEAMLAELQQSTPTKP